MIFFFFRYLLCKKDLKELRYLFYFVIFLISMFFLCPPEVLWGHELLDEALNLRVPQHACLRDGWKEAQHERNLCQTQKTVFCLDCTEQPHYQSLLRFMVEITRKLQNNQAELNANIHQNRHSSRPRPHPLFLITTVQFFFFLKVVTNIINPCRYSCCCGLNAEVFWVFYFLMFSYLTWKKL